MPFLFTVAVLLATMTDSHKNVASATLLSLESPNDLKPKGRIVYLVRHAESRYNAAMKSRSLSRLIGERDHGLSENGRSQCEHLCQKILVAAEHGDPDALAIISRKVTYSSPLSRAVCTAYLSFPPQKQSSSLSQTANPVVVLPDAREHCMMRLFARDSEGTAKSALQEKVEKELAEEQGTVVIDTTHVSREQWWTIGESQRSIDDRLAQLLDFLYSKAPPIDGKKSPDEAAVVLVTHSRVIRAAMRSFHEGKASQEQSDARKILAVGGEGKDVTRNLVENCAVLRLRLVQRRDSLGLGNDRAMPPEQPSSLGTTIKEPRTAIRISDAEFLFGTGFK